jgi:hypothetical protein
VRDFYNENSKPLKKERKYFTRQKDLPCSWIGRINIVRMAMFPKAIYMFNLITISVHMTVITETKQSPYSSYRCTKDRIVKAIRSKKSNAQATTIPD